MDVEPHARRPTRDHDRVSRQRCLPPERGAVDPVPFQQRLGAVSEEDRLGRAVEHRRADLFRRDRRQGPPRRVAHVADDSLQQIHETLGAGVHDARLLEGLHLLRRVLERPLGFLQRVREDHGEVRDVPRADRHVLRPVANDRQDRALDRPRDGAVGGLRGGQDGFAEVARRHPRAVREALVETAEELRQDRAGVAPRPAESLVRERRAHPPDVALLEPGDPGGHLLQRAGEVGAGVAVRDGKDVDLVERLGALPHEVRARDHRPGEPPAVQVRDRNHDPSGAGCPSRARSPWRSERNSSATAGSRSR